MVQSNTIYDREVVYTVGSTATTGPFDIPFLFQDPDEITVLVGGVVETALTITQASMTSLSGNYVTLDNAVSDTTVTILSTIGEKRQTADTFVQSELSAELDRIFGLFQELSQKFGRTVRLGYGEEAGVYYPQDGRSPVWDETNKSFTNGPTGDDIANAQSYANAAQAAKVAAEIAQSAAEAAQIAAETAEDNAEASELAADAAKVAAEAAEVAAAASASAAATSEGNAANSASAASSSASAAASDAQAAAQDALDASNSETAAASSASAAATSAGNASTSETNAADSETKAEKWAEEAEDVEVETGKYSAKHHATKAANSDFGSRVTNALGLVGEPIVFNSSGTYTPTAGARYAVVEMQGAGGAGGGVNGSNNVGSGAPGGCSGVWCRFVVDLTALTGNPTITIGAAGTGAVALDGTAGGDTSYDDTLVGGTHNITAHGGPGGQNPGNVGGERIHDPNYTIPVATATSGSILTSRPGVAGDAGIVLNGSGNGSDVAGGSGGDSLYGAGGKWTSNNTSGDNATGYGAAGSGANQGGNDTTNRAGGDGADGIAIITEFF